MSEPVKKLNQTNPEGYSPEVPKLVNMMEDAQNVNQNEFIRHGSFEYRFDVVEFPENIKVAGVPEYHGGFGDGYIAEYQQKYDSIMRSSDNSFKPYTPVDMWASALGIEREHPWTSGNRIMGCLVKSLDDLPDGLIGAEIDAKKFLVMTVRGEKFENCQICQYPIENDMFRKLIPVEYADAICPPIEGCKWHFVLNNDETNCMSYWEIFDDSFQEPGSVTVKFYAPMK